MIHPYSDHDSLTSYRHKSLIAYLSSINIESTKILQDELSVGENFDDVTRAKYEGILERKWTSVMRLQKRVSFYIPQPRTLLTPTDI